MKRHNKHQLYPKSGAASFQQASGCCGAELLLRTPIINLGEGGVGGTFPPSFPFVPLPPASLLAKSCRESRRRRDVPPAAAAEQLRGGGRGWREGGQDRERKGGPGAVWRDARYRGCWAAPDAHQSGPAAGHGVRTHIRTLTYTHTYIHTG